MSNNDIILSQIRQRLEILYQMVDELEASGGGGGGGGTTNYNELSNKPSIEGQQLVGNKTASDLGLATTSQLNRKVDKVQGSSLMTTAQANKLEGIESGAEVNVQANWNETDTTSDAYILNKPTLPDMTNYYTKSQVDASQAIQNTEIGSLVDRGAKNIADINATKTAYHATYTVSGQEITITNNGNYARVAIPVHAKAGSYKFSCGVTYSSGSVEIRFAQNADSSGTIADKITVSASGNVSRNITLDTDMDFYVVLYTNTTSSSASNVIKFNNIMICPATDYAVSTAFAPYAPTNRELYEGKIDHDIPALTGSILTYAVSLPAGLYFARHGASDGSDKPESGKRYMYQIMKYATATMTLIAYEGQGANSNSIYMKNYTSNIWGPWVKFTGTAVS